MKKSNIAFTAFATVAALALYSLMAQAHAAEAITIQRIDGGALILRGEAPSAAPHIFSVTPDLSDEAMERAARWEAYCKPRTVVGDLGVEYYVYAKPGCQYGRDHD